MIMMMMMMTLTLMMTMMAIKNHSWMRSPDVNYTCPPAWSKFPVTDIIYSFQIYESRFPGDLTFLNWEFSTTKVKRQKWKKQPEVQWWEALEGGFLRTRATVWVSLRAVEVWLTTERQLTMVLDTVMTVRLPWSNCWACCCCDCCRCCHPPPSPPGCCPCCPAVWDGFLCWPPAPIDTIVEQPCPADFPQLNAASRNISSILNIWKIWIFGIFSNISSTQRPTYLHHNLYKQNLSARLCVQKLQLFGLASGKRSCW